MYLEMIFGKNKKQTIRQTQFKIWPASSWFDIDLSFSREMDKSFWHPTILSIVQLLWPTMLEKWFGPILKQIYGRSFTKKLISGTWKMNFSYEEDEKFLNQHCLSFQHAPLCQIWDHFNKLCHEYGHEIDHVAWKPWIFTHDSSFVWTLFKNYCRITSLLFYMVTLSLMMT